MPDSPACFRSPWDDDLDVDFIADRVGGGTFDRLSFAEHLGVSEKSVWTMVGRGHLPHPDGQAEVETAQGVQHRAVWSAPTLARVLIERRCVPGADRGAEVT